MSFTGSVNTGFEVHLGDNPKVGGDNDGFRRLELMAVSLAGGNMFGQVLVLHPVNDNNPSTPCQRMAK